MFGIPPRSIWLLLVVFTHTALTDLLTMSGVGHNVILPCRSSVGSCSDVTWHHNIQHRIVVVVKAGRFHMDSYCALHVDNITQADVGRYWCGENTYDIHYLSIITVSSVPTSGLVPGGVRVTLRCRLLTFYGYEGCSYTDFRGVTLKWKDDIQQDSKPLIQRNSKCDVLLTVTIQRDITFSCQALVNDRVQSTLEVPVLLPGLKGMTSLSLSHTTCAVGEKAFPFQETTIKVIMGNQMQRHFYATPTSRHASNSIGFSFRKQVCIRVCVCVCIYLYRGS
ncbi:hypothetical protein N1851_031144 [Merluccius polli]|uniref:Ig-like domain-containing protein n=1 Tax=Merluccius polli TaxID=89951 RepID=A0AA47M479_MERPO|nr:hypothetical protein N1851_031144 [Merluccius polli]